MSYKRNLICIRCGNIIIPRYRKHYFASGQPVHKRRCSKCRGYHFIKITEKEIDDLITEGFIQRVKRLKSDKYKEIREILKAQPTRAAAPRSKPQAQEVRPRVLEEEPGPQYPGCFGIKTYLANGYGIDRQDCFECKYRPECRKKVLSKK